MISQSNIMWRGIMGRTISFSKGNCKIRLTFEARGGKVINTWIELFSGFWT